MSRCRFLVVVAATLALLSCSRGPAAGPPRAATHTAEIDWLHFQPEVLTVKAGDSVVWINKDPFPHTVTSSSGGFDSHDIAPGASWTYTAATKGDFSYSCTYHPMMNARLRVE